MYVNTRPYIVLNNKTSRLIKGLIISELPPISKPKVRTKIETVDGRDGDLVTVLGYSAYDKTVKIALTYDYDIDDIISFFSSSGVVTFSNEPEKYYKYSIYNQIDFERLLRFKTAEVTFHVQPFKYAESESERSYTFTAPDPELVIRDNGNIYSRPRISITGSGVIGLSINDIEILTIRLGSNQTIVIDGETMNATSADGDTLLNRLVTGNYDNIKLNVGSNKLSFTGSVSRISIANYSRWI